MTEPFKGKAMTLLQMKKLLSEHPELIDTMYRNAWNRILIPMDENEYELSEQIYKYLEDDMKEQIEDTINKYEKDPHNSQLHQDLEDIRETSMVAVATQFNGKNYTYIIQYYSGITEKNTTKNIEDFKKNFIK